MSLDWSEGNRGGGQEEEGACKEGEVEPQVLRLNEADLQQVPVLQRTWSSQ